MQLVKAMLKTLLILAGLAVFAVLILASILIISPKTTILGYSYVNNNTTTHNVPTNYLSDVGDAYDPNNYDTIVVNGGSADIVFSPYVDYGNAIYVEIDDQIKGFRKINETAETVNNDEDETNDIDYSKISVDISLSDGILTFNINEPTGLVLYGTSRVVVYLPEGALTDKEYVVDATNGDLSYDFITPYGFDFANRNDTTEYIAIKKLTADLTKGSLLIDDASILSASIPALIDETPLPGETTEDTTIRLATLLSEQTGLNITGNPKVIEINKALQGHINVDVTNSAIKFLANVTGDINVKAKNSSISATTIIGDLVYSGVSGYITATSIDGDYTIYTTLNCDTIIGRIDGSVYVGGEETGLGSVAIDEIIGDTTITTYRGNINIEKLYGVTIIETKYGNITIDEMYNQIDITTEYGTIDLTMALYITGTTPTDDYDIKIRGKDGDILVNNVKGFLDLAVLTEGTADVTVNFAKIAQSPADAELVKVNTIITQKGAVNISIKTNSNFTFSMSSQTNATLATILKTIADLVDLEYKTITNAVYNYSDDVIAANSFISIISSTGKITITLVD
ncbi:MAG: hypothetical protein WCX32_04495 [Clostridia bacterium]